MKKFKGILILSVIIIITVFLQKNNVFNIKSANEKLYNSIPINYDENVVTYKNYIYIYGKNGIRIIQNNEVIFKDNYTYDDPYLLQEKDKVIIGEKSGKDIRVYSSSGLMYTVNYPSDILSFTLNQNGFSSITAKNQNDYEIMVYNDLGENIFGLKNITFNEGIPVNIAVSNDNSSLAVSFIKADAAYVQSNIAVYSLDNGEESSNQMFGAFKKDNQFSGILKFLDNQNLFIASDREFSVIKINEKYKSAKEILKKPFNNKVKFIDFLDTSGFLISYGHSLLKAENENEIPENTVIFYNFNGGKTGEYKFDNNITDIFTGVDLGIVAQGRFFSAISKSGSIIWKYQATQDIKKICILNEKNKALIVTNNEIITVDFDKKAVNKLGENNEKQEVNTEESADTLEESTEIKENTADEKIDIID